MTCVAPVGGVIHATKFVIAGVVLFCLLSSCRHGEAALLGEELEMLGCAQVEDAAVPEERGYVLTSATCRDGGAHLWLSRTLPTPQERSVADGGGSEKAPKKKVGPPRVFQREIVDRLAVGVLPDGEYLSVAPYCYLNKKEIIWGAIYQWRGRRVINTENGGLRRAWVVDPKTLRLVSAPPTDFKNATCLSDADE